MSKRAEIGQTKHGFSSGDSEASIKNFIEEMGEFIKQLSTDQIIDVIIHSSKALRRIVDQKWENFDQCNNLSG